VLPDGELVLTSLTKEALPVIRYRTRDRTRLLPPTSRAMRRLGRINGRTDDVLILRGVNVFPSQIEELILKSGAFMPLYLLEVTREGHRDAMTVHVEWPPTSPAGPGERQVAAARLVELIKATVGISVRVAVAEPMTLDRSVGKARRVLDRCRE